MCKYINFNNLKKKKRFYYLWKHKNKKEKIRKIIYYLNSKKTMKISFLITQKTKQKNKKNTPFSPNKFFVFFIFNNENIY